MKKLYIITGASSGIGKALTTLLINKGSHDVLGISRQATIEHPSYQHIHQDLSQSLSDSFFSELSKNLGQPEITHFVLVNNAGTVSPIGPIGSLNKSQIEQAFQLNTISPFVITNFLVNFALEKNLPLKVLNIGTGASTNPIDGWSSYCSTKAALSMLTKVWKTEAEQKKWNIDIQEFSPGVIDTPMQSEIRNANKDQFSRIEQFKKFSTDNALESPAITSEKIYAIIG